MTSPGANEWRARIDGLLGEPVETARARERAAFAAALRGTDGTVVLFGAGRLGRLCARALARAGVPLRAFCDNNRALWGTAREGVPVLSPAEAARRFGRALFVVAIWTGAAHESMNDRLALLRGFGCRFAAPYSPLVWAHAAEEVPFHSLERPATILRRADAWRELAAALSDDESLRTLHQELRQRLHADFPAQPPAPDQYFPPLWRCGASEAVVDGGAYDGDTLRAWLARFPATTLERYWAFEPDPLNRAKLTGTVATLPEPLRSRIEISPAALHDADTELKFSADGTVGSAVNAGGTVIVPARRLDAVLGGRRVTFLKLDIEGAEVAALRGAAETLQRHQPAVAACAYHGPDDLWEVPLLVRKLLPRHSLHLRAHGFDGWETVCYAVPPS
jgi:FkbM family methyltransferase